MGLFFSWLRAKGKRDLQLFAGEGKNPRSGRLKRLVMQKQQLIFFKGQAGECAAVIVRELDLKHARSEQFHDGAHLPAAELAIGQIFNQRHNIQKLDFLVHFRPPILKNVAARQSREAFSSPNDPAASNHCLSGWSLCHEVYHITPTIFIMLIQCGIIGRRRRQQGVAQIPGMIARYSQGRRKDAGFVTTAAMLGIQAVIPQLNDIDNRAFSIRQLHGTASPLVSLLSFRRYFSSLKEIGIDFAEKINPRMAQARRSQQGPYLSMSDFEEC
jgi:hypothetical protein